MLSVTNSPGAIINWQQFSIGANEATRFIQQSAASSVLNRVVGVDPSSILGTLQSNGRVFLVGSAVDNQGVITAPGGDIVLAAGKSVRVTESTFVGANTELRADAIDSGDGGKVVIWADEFTRYFGNISARGGANGGSGGAVEVSGKRDLMFAGVVDTSAPKGAAGTLLLDPDDLYISTGPAGGAIAAAANPFQANDGTNDYYVLNTTLQPLSASTAVQLQANHDFIFQTGLAMATTGAGSITMTASNAITMAGFGLTTAGGSVAMTAGAGGITNLGAISLGSGTLTLNSSGGMTQNAGSLIAGATSLVKQGTGTLTLANANTYTGATTINAGVLSVSSLANGGVASNIGASTAAAANLVLGGGTAVTSGATLQIANVAIGNEAVTLNGNGVGGNGALSATGSVSLAGGVTVNTASTVGVATGADALTLAGAVDGPGALSLTGAGSVTLGGTVGSTTALVSLAQSAATMLNLNGGLVRTTGNQTV